MRAILLARATVTNIFGLRANSCASHDPFDAPRRLACRTTVLAPMISRRRIVRSERTTRRFYGRRPPMLGALSMGEPDTNARLRERRRQTRDDTNGNDQGNSVADAAIRDLIAEPH